MKSLFMQSLNSLDKEKLPRPQQIDSLFWKTEGFTPLHFAARYGHEAVVKELLAHKPNLQLEDYAGFLAYDWMEVQEQGEVFLESVDDGTKDALKQASCVSKMTSMKRSEIAKDIEEEKEAMEKVQHAWKSGTRPRISRPFLRWFMEPDEEVEVIGKDVDAVRALTLAISESSFWMAKELLLLEPKIVLDYRVAKTVKQQLSDANLGKLDEETVDFIRALVTSEKLAGASNLMRWMLQWAQKKKESDVVEVILDRPELKRGLYEERQVYLDCANALLVGAALIAGVAFQAWLQPPLGYNYEYDGEQYAEVQKVAVRMFWWFNNAAFFLSVGTLIAGAKGAVPVAQEADIIHSVEKGRAVAVASTLLGLALVCVVVAFVSAGLAALPPIHSDLQIMYISGRWGVPVCALALLWFALSVWPLLLDTIRYFFFNALPRFAGVVVFFLEVFARLYLGLPLRTRHNDRNAE